MLIAVLALTASNANAQTALRDELLRDWVEMKASMHRLADEMPADAYAYRATAAQRDFGQQVAHVATANVLNLGFLGGDAEGPTIDRNGTTKAAALAAMDASFDFGHTLLESRDDSWLMETVETNVFLGPSTRARVVWFLLGHSWDIYGQMVVYLRLNDGIPPASQRP
jgi:hypothetical protein